jgi:hypothetical protein
MFSDEIVSVYKNPAALVLFPDVEMKGSVQGSESNNQFNGWLNRKARLMRRAFAQFMESSLSVTTRVTTRVAAP